jgi:hypothetical protein
MTAGTKELVRPIGNTRRGISLNSLLSRNQGAAGLLAPGKVQVTWALPGIQCSSAKAPRMWVPVAEAGNPESTLPNILRH